MMDKKIITSLVIALFLILSLSVAIVGFFHAWFQSNRVLIPNNQYEYYKSVEYCSFDKKTFLKIRYYHSDADISSIIKDNYIFVDNNINDIKEFIKSNITILNESDLLIDFNYDLITSDDEYKIFEDDHYLSLEFFDKENKALYIFVQPKNELENEG